MSAALHLSALVAAVVATAVLLVRPRGTQAAAVAASVVMVAAMADLTLWRAVPAVWWVAAQLAFAVVLAVVARCAGSRPDVDGRASRGAVCPLAVHAALGLVVMAACAATMGGAGDGPGVVGDAIGVRGHDHTSPTGLLVVLGGLVVGWAAVTARHMRLLPHLRHRVHAGLMLASAGAMLVGAAAGV